MRLSTKLLDALISIYAHICIYIRLRTKNGLMRVFVIYDYFFQRTIIFFKKWRQWCFITYIIIMSSFAIGYLVCFIDWLFVADFIIKWGWIIYSCRTQTLTTWISTAFLVYGFLIIFCGVFIMYMSIFSMSIIFCLAIVHILLYLYWHFIFFMYNGGCIVINLGKFFMLFSSAEINLYFLIDQISYSFLVLTLSIALFTNIYILIYFRGEPSILKLILLINFFVFSMIFLLVSGNIILLFFGWEMIGFSSFLLISFWSSRINSFKSGFKAFAFNKFSDIFILFFVILSYYYAVSGDIELIISLNSFFTTIAVGGFSNIRVVDILSWSIIIPAAVKSAQFGFHIWLPDSMEAPAPASALIHSATLVSAGIYLLIRFMPLLELSSFATSFIPFISAITAFVGGITAFNHNDAKKILAYSTISHCGFLFYLSSLGLVHSALIYLYIHGFFKACAFFSTGIIISFSQNYQDLRKMGFYIKYLFNEFSVLTFCLANLAGLPFFIGFFLKHDLLTAAAGSCWHRSSSFIIWSAAPAGLFYSYKMIYYIFFDERRADFFTYSFFISNISYRQRRFNLVSYILNAFFQFFLSFTIITLFMFCIWAWFGHDLYIEIFNPVRIYKRLDSRLGEIFYFSTLYYNLITALLILLLLYIQWREKFYYSIYYFISLLYIYIIV